jgi:hypothetical protein
VSATKTERQIPPVDPAPILAAEQRRLDALPDPLTIEEICAFDRLESPTVAMWCREGRFPGAARIGHMWRIPKAAYLAWRRSNR